MKQHESDYLDSLFSPESGSDASNDEFPLCDVPSDLTQKLYAIAEEPQTEQLPPKAKVFDFWPKLTAVAASLLVAVVVAQFYQQQQTIKQLEQAQADLKTALHYLGEANRIARSEVLESVNKNMRRAGVEPALQFEHEEEDLMLDEPEPTKHSL